MGNAQPALWAYNYDFEFELGKQHKILLHERDLAPWYYLNRSSNLLLPFLGTRDALVTYPNSNKDLTRYLCGVLDIDPMLLEISLAHSETNSVLADLLQDASQLSQLRGFQLSPWGWSPKAGKIHGLLSNSNQPPFALQLVQKVNSKRFSTLLRESLPSTYRIPSKLVNEDIEDLSELKELILSFHAEHDAFFVKNFFGTSGKQSDFYRSSAFSPRKLRRWKHWITETGGFLLEKAVTIQQEFSLQIDIKNDGTISPIVLTDMFSTSNGSYLGNIIYRNKEIPQRLLDDLHPLLQQISNEGYRGSVGIDFIQTDSGETKLLEINCRITMGRVAYEWIRKISPSPIGLFANFFVPNNRFPTYNSFFELANNLSNAYNCSFLPINFIPSEQNSNSLVSICIGANTKETALALIDELKPSVFKSVNS